MLLRLQMRASVHLVAAAQIHGAVLHIRDIFQRLTGTVSHAGDGVIRYPGADACLAFDELVKAVDQAWEVLRVCRI